MLGDDEIRSLIESLLFAQGGPVAVTALSKALEVPRAAVVSALEALRVSRLGGIRVQVHDGQAQLVTAPENAAAVQRFLGAAKPPTLSRAALESLTIVAYRQPVTRPEIEAARGVSADRAVQTLLARGLIEERGKRESLGRPTEYGTTFAFLEYFGLASLEDLPPLGTEDTEPTIDAASLGMRASPGQ